MLPFYNLGIRLYSAAIRIAAPFNSKAGKWVSGRSDWRSKIAEEAKKLDRPIWMHCASLGEFEQGRPVLEAIRKNHPEIPIVLSFYSPSGYEVRKNWKGADHVFYLPADTTSNADYLVDVLKPRMAVWVKYELWLNHFKALQEASVPLLLISGIFRKDQVYFKGYGASMAKRLGAIDHCFVQNEASKALAEGIGLSAEVTGDTRFDRVSDIAAGSFSVEPVKAFIEEKPTVVLGSSWGKEEAFIAKWCNEHPEAGIKVVVVPHEIGESHLNEIEKRFDEDVIRYSKLRTDSECRVLLVDQIGLLSRIYREAELAVIGGGFGAGIHNTLEAAVYNLPVIFGPKFDRFQEAKALIASGGGVSFSNYEGFHEHVSLLMHEEGRERLKAMGMSAGQYVASQTGATNRIMEYIESKL